MTFRQKAMVKMNWFVPDVNTSPYFTLPNQTQILHCIVVNSTPLVSLYKLTSQIQECYSISYHIIRAGIVSFVHFVFFTSCLLNS